MIAHTSKTMGIKLLAAAFIVGGMVMSIVTMALVADPFASSGTLLHITAYVPLVAFIIGGIGLVTMWKKPKNAVWLYSVASACNFLTLIVLDTVVNHAAIPVLPYVFVEPSALFTLPWLTFAIAAGVLAWAR